MLEAKSIREKTSEQLRVRLGKRWFTPESGKLIVTSRDIKTDFMIEIDLYAERRFGGYDCSAVVVIKWKRFANAFRNFIKWYNIKFNESARPSFVFLRAPFNGINVDFLSGSRGAFWVEDENDLDAFIAQCAEDIDGKVGEWIKKWFTWPSALALLDNNKSLCGSWRDTAYFCLIEQIRGREAACSWVHGLDSADWPELLAAQVDYLRSHACQDD